MRCTILGSTATAGCSIGRVEQKLVFISSCLKHLIALAIGNILAIKLASTGTTHNLAKSLRRGHSVSCVSFPDVGS